MTLAPSGAVSRSEEGKASQVDSVDTGCGVSRKGGKGDGESNTEAIEKLHLPKNEGDSESADKSSYEGRFWNLPYDTVSIQVWVLYEWPGTEYKLKLRNEDKKTIVKMNSTVVSEESQTKLWREAIPRDVRSPQLYVKGKRRYVWDYTKYHQIDLPENLSYFFIFPSVVQCSGDHGRFPSPYECLRYYSEILLNEHSYAVFPELIQQFQCSAISKLGEVGALYKLCEAYCKGDHHEYGNSRLSVGCYRSY